ncbi:hypothetical protein DVG78_28995 [Runella aurantiaca]|uniref:Uncharacterized protein n=1 Tax=Runella aurantiaca TaxID=2282308 RepID=A0A369I1M4_9BACT|nr:hypothetical protein DVG78_28995 [Runella aurantiaca]
MDKIIINRTIFGIRCTDCGGNLVITKKRMLLSHCIRLVSFGLIKPEQYECENCKKKYLLI